MSKYKILPFLGVLVLVVFILLSYLNDRLMLDELMTCSFVLTLLFLGNDLNRSLQNKSINNEFSKDK